MEPNSFLTEFFYGDEAEQFTFFRIPRLLITSPRFKGLSTEAKLLYGMMLDRMGLSMKNSWHEEDGRVFIFYTVEEISEDLNCGREKAIKLLAELDAGKGFGLIARKRQGQGKPTKIFVKRFTTREVPAKPTPEEPPKAPEPEIILTDVQTSGMPISRGLENRPLEVGKPDFWDSEKQTSRSRNPGLQEVGKSDPSYINNNYTDLSQTDLSILPSTEALAREETMTDGLTDGKAVRERIKKQIDYIVLPYRLKPWELRQADELIELMVEVEMNRAPTLRIGHAEYSTAYVRDRFRRITCENIENILAAFGGNLPKVTNVKAYMLAALFNSVTTVDNAATLEDNYNFGVG